jgi:hypothetical protein
MTRHFLIIFLIFNIAFSNAIFSQFTIYPTSPISSPIDLDAGVNWTGICASPGTKANISFNVSGLPNTLNSTFNIVNINIRFDATCGGDIAKVKLILKSPSGVCYVFFDGSSTSSLMNSAPGASDINVNLRDNPSCGASLAWPNFKSTNFLLSKTTSGNNGFYRAGCNTCASQLATATLVSTFSGLNPNGTWTIYAQSTASSPNGPCIKDANFVFGNPSTQDRTPDGNDCATPIVYNGTPFCASTQGKSGSLMMPGSLNAPGVSPQIFGTINGSNCRWNGANNNEIWVRYTPPTSGYFCINISGLSAQQQSIVVTDANRDGDNNPCTQLNDLKTATDDPYWNVVSCPNPGSVYSGLTTGTSKNQQHCFTAVANTNYYIVIDGEGGAESPFYVSGMSGPTQATLPDAFVKLTGESFPESNRLRWDYVLDQSAIQRYELERSSNGTQFHRVYSQLLSSTDEPVKQYTDQSPLPSTNFYRLKVTLKDGTIFYSSVVELKGKGRNGISVYPNPVVNELHIDAANKIDQINIFNSQGQLVYSDASVSVQTLKISTLDWNKGQYLVVVRDILGNIETTRIVK